MEDTLADSSQVSQLQQRVAAGRPTFAELGDLRARMLDSLVRKAPALPRYRLGRVLGSGSFGIVYEAHDLRLGRRVAIKLITCGRAPDEVARVLREARMLATLSHPNIVHVFEVGQTADARRSPYVVMELVPGRTLRRWLADTKPSWRQIIDVVVQAAAGLRAAHLAGVVHRDIKPDNLLIGDDARPRVIDFGLAREFDDHDLESAVHTLGGETGTELTPTGQVMGTPAYMAPEVFGSQCTPLSDQYSLCITLYEALFGVRPFKAASTDDLREQVLAREPRLPIDRRRVPARVQRVVMRGLRRDPGRRYPDLSALVDALARARRPAHLVPAAVLGTGLLAATAAIGAEREPACITADRAWEPARALPRLSDAVEHTRIGYERAWRDTEQQLCAAGEGAMAPAQRHCLDARARDAVALLAVLAEIDESDPHADDDPLRDLAPPSECAGPDHDSLARPDASIAPRIERLEQPMSRLRALAGTWQVSEGLELAAMLAEELRAVDYAPMAIEVSYLNARLLFQASDYEAAAAAFEETFLLAQREHFDRRAASSATELLRVHGWYRGDVEQARRWAAHADAAYRRAGIDPMSRPTHVVGLAGLAELEGDYARSVELLQQGLEHTHGPFRGTLMNHYGVALYRLDRFDECEAALGEAAALLEEFHGAVSPSRAAALANRGLCLSELQRHEEALTLHREALAIREATIDAHHTDMAASYGNLAEVLGQLDRPDEAMAWIEKARELFAARLGADHPAVAQSFVIRGRIAARAGRTAQARGDYQRALAMYTALGDDRSVQQLQTSIAELGAETK